jgi:hypothetical protein
METLTAAPAEATAWRHGDRLVLGPGANLPNLCARCGKPAARRWFTAYPWSGRLVWLLRRSAPTLHKDLSRYAPAFEAAIPLCGAHMDERKSDFQNTLAVLVAGLSAVLLSDFWFIPYRLHVWMIVLGLSTLAAGLYFATRIDPLRTADMTPTHLQLTGAAPELLAALPDAPPEMDLEREPGVPWPPAPPQK